MRVSVKSGSLFDGLSAIGAGTAILLPEAKWVGGCLVAVGFLALLFDVRLESGRFLFGAAEPLGRRLRAAVPGFAVLGVAVAGYLWFSQLSDGSGRRAAAYDLSGERRAEFLELLKANRFAPRDDLRIGCLRQSESACVAAGQFMVLLSEAGWRIYPKEVLMMEASRPESGMTIAAHGNEADQAKYESLPPHLGLWERTDASQLSIREVFLKMGIPVHFSRDTSLPPHTLGIYFGPEPARGPALR